MIYAILSAVFGGLYNFTLKMIASRGYNPSLMLIYSYMWSVPFALAYMLFVGGSFAHTIVIAFLAFVSMIVIFISLIARIESMKCIDSVIFFPLHKTIGPIVVTVISFVIFSESLTIREGLGILIGICVPLLLITTTENMIQKNLRRGILYLLVTVFFSSLGTIPMKYIATHGYDQGYFVLLGAVFGIAISSLSFRYFEKAEGVERNHTMIEYLRFGVIVGFLNIGGAITFVNAMTGNLAVVFTINSFSILIPIILSIWFYKEHFSVKKGLVIVLSIVSIILFI